MHYLVVYLKFKIFEIKPQYFFGRVVGNWIIINLQRKSHWILLLEHFGILTKWPPCVIEAPSWILVKIVNNLGNIGDRKLVSKENF